MGSLGKVFYYSTEKKWNEQNSGTTSWLFAIRGNSKDNIYAVGDYGTILHYDGSKWKRCTSNTNKRLMSVCVTDSKTCSLWVRMALFFVMME